MKEGYVTQIGYTPLRIDILNTNAVGTGTTVGFKLENSMEKC
jgi:hypothetical protein